MIDEPMLDDPEQPDAPEVDPLFRDYLGCMPLNSEEVTAAVIDRAKLWTKKLRETGLYAQAEQSMRLYHNQDPDDDTGGEEAFDLVVDEEGNETIRIRVNEFRSFLTHILNMVTTGPSAMKSRASNDESDSMDAAQVFDAVLDHYVKSWKDGRFDKMLRKAVEYSLFLMNGYWFCGWDKTAGKPFAVGELGEVINQGDLTVDSATIFDVYFDPEIEDEAQLDCVIWRQWVNKYHYAARYRDRAAEIINLGGTADGDTSGAGADKRDSDLVAVYHTFFPSSTLLPEGRYIVSIAEGAPLLDGPNPYTDKDGLAFIPMLVVRAAEGTGSLYGYSPGNDLAPIQVARNKAWAVMLTNFFAFGVQSVASPRGSDIAVTALSGLKWLEYNPMPGVPNGGRPEGLQLTQEPKSGFEIIDRLSKEGENSSGVNSVARGDPESSLKAASGKALALIQAQAIEYHSPLNQSYHRLRQNGGNMALKIFQKFATAPRILSLVGKNKVAKSQRFDASIAQKVSAIEVELVNPLSRTTPGLQEQAEFLIQNKMITQVQEYLNLINTGRYEPLIAAEQSQLDLIHQENELLMAGKAPRAIRTDNNWRQAPTPDWPTGKPWHVASHETLLANVKVRQPQQGPMGEPIDNPILVAVLTHIAEHESFEPAPMPMGPPGQMGPVPPDGGSEPPPMEALPPGPEQGAEPGSAQAMPSVVG